MLIKSQTRADARALMGAVALGAGMGVILGGCYLAGGAARTAIVHAQAARIARTAPTGFSEQALQAAAANMEPGALAIARRHDPYTVAGSAQRDRDATAMAARAEPSTPVGGQLLRANYQHVTITPARPFHEVLDNPTDSARALECLSDAVYYEARGEGADGMAAVAQVVINRVRHPAFPKSVCGVVFQGAQSHSCQFSFACNGAMRRPKEPAAWRRAQSIAARAMGGFVMAEVGHATHFHVASIGAGWGGNLLRVAQIGSQVFYRFAGRGGRPAAFHDAPSAYAAASELAEKPIYANRSDLATDADASAKPLILAAAVTTAPAALGEGGPFGPSPEPASAPKAVLKPAINGAATAVRPAAPEIIKDTAPKAAL